MLAAHKTLTSLACLAGLLPSYCAGSGSAYIKTPVGDIGLGYKYVKHNRTLVTVSTTLPPNYPGGSTTVEGRTVTLPANPTESPMQITIDAKDPVILQIPIDWTLDSATITTALGTGNVVIGPGGVPSMVQFPANGLPFYSEFFQEEPGYQLFFCDIPPGLAALGDVSGTLDLGIPVGAQRVDTIKIIETWRVTASVGTGVYTYYAPIAPYESDFALIDDFAHTFIVDGETLPCTSSAGFSPKSEPSAVDWNLGATTSVDASNLDPSLATAMMLGMAELQSPVTIGNSGCRLLLDYQDSFSVTVTPDGTASLPVTVPVNSSFVGTGLVWQPAQLDSAANDVITGSTLRVRIEP